MGTTPNLSLPYPELDEPADVPADIQQLAEALDGKPALSPTVATTLPASPYDGQEVYYRYGSGIPVNQGLWHLRFRSELTGSYKWEFIGGTQLSNFNGITYGTTNTAWHKGIDFGEAPGVSVPLPGYYDVTLSVGIGNTGTGVIPSVGQFGVSPYSAPGGLLTKLADPDSSQVIHGSHLTPTNLYQTLTLARYPTLNDATEAVFLQGMYKATSGNPEFYRPHIRATPRLVKAA